MKLSKKILLGLGAVSVIALASCQSSSSSSDTSSLYTQVAYDWLRLGQSTGETISPVYQTAIYDPTTAEGFSDTSYYTIYAPTDINSSIRLTLTEINSDTFKEGASSVVQGLETLAYSDTYKGYVESKLSDKKSDVEASITSFTASLQTSFQMSFDDYNISSSSLVEDKTNYLAVYYMPLFIRVYSSGTITSAGFMCMPVLVSTVTGSVSINSDGVSTISSDDTLAQSFISASKYITYTYDSSTGTIA